MNRAIFLFLLIVICSAFSVSAQDAVPSPSPTATPYIEEDDEILNIHLISLKKDIDILNLLPFRAYYHELEEEDVIKVSEHVDIDEHGDFGIGLDVGLNVDKVSQEVIEKFITAYNSDTLKLDDTLYSFQFDHGEDED